MKIELIKQIINDGDYINYGLKYKKLKYCCDKMENNPLIDLVEDADNDYNMEGLLPSVTLCYSKHIIDYEDEWEEDTYYKINYCPFCGEPIEISIIMEEDISEIYNNIKNKRYKLWEECCDTGNIKRIEEIRKNIFELDNKINYFYSLVEYDESWREW